jgi:hypothetical protein
MYMINNNDIFMQVRKGEMLVRLVNPEICGGDKAEDRPGEQRHPHPPSCSWDD